MKIDVLMHKCARTIISKLFESNTPQYATTIFKKTGITYSHVTEIVKLMVESGIIERKELDGRTKGLFLTEKGKTIARSLNSIKNILEEK